MYSKRYTVCWGHMKGGRRSSLRLYTPAKNKLPQNQEWIIDRVFNHNSMQAGIFIDSN